MCMGFQVYVHTCARMCPWQGANILRVASHSAGHEKIGLFKTSRGAERWSNGLLEENYRGADLCGYSYRARFLALLLSFPSSSAAAPFFRFAAVSPPSSRRKARRARAQKA